MKKKVPSEKLTHEQHLCLNDVEKAMIQEMAKETGITQAELFRMALRFYYRHRYDRQSYLYMAARKQRGKTNE